MGTLDPAETFYIREYILVNTTAGNANKPGGRELPKASLAHGAKGEKVFLKRDI
jgi:hypothetical protein